MTSPLNTFATQTASIPLSQLDANFTYVNGKIVSVKDYGAVGDGVTDDTAAVLAASVAAAAVGGVVDFPAGIYLLGSTLALTSSHDNLKWRLDGATIKKGFNGDLVTVTGTNNFSIDGVGIIDGNMVSYTGFGFVVTGAASHRFYIGPGILTKAFASAHVKYGADAGYHTKLLCDMIGDATQSAPEMILCAGTDTSAMQRHFEGSVIGHITLNGALSTVVKCPLVNYVGIDANCSVTIVSDSTWSNGSNAVTIHGATTIITGCRFSGDVTLASDMTGAFVGNAQNGGTFTDSTTGGNCLVYHHPLSQSYQWLNKCTLSTISGHDVGVNSTAAVGDANITYTPDSTATTLVFASNLTANRTVTLSTTGARVGTRCCISRSGGDTGGPWTIAVGATGKTLATKTWCIAQYNGSYYEVIQYGTLP